MIIMFKGLLYLAFALLFGGLLLASIPEQKRPNLKIHRELLLWTVVLIPIIMFVLLLKIIQYLGGSIGYWATFTSVLFDFNVGKAWLASVLIASVLFVLVLQNNLNETTFYARLGLFLTIVLMSTYSFSSHAASLYPSLGFLAHFLHIVAVSAWVGVLIYVAWGSHPHSKWLSFLEWYTPFSIGAVLILTGGGLLLMEITTPQYVDSWVLNYGQALLIKHVLLIPLLFYAGIHGFYLKSSLKKKGSHHVQRSLQGETIIVLFIFAVTGFLSQQTPPHEVWRTLLQQNPSPLFLSIYDGWIHKKTIISYGPTSETLIWGAGALLMACLTLFSIVKRWQLWVGILCGLATSTFVYYALMASVH